MSMAEAIQDEDEQARRIDEDEEEDESVWAWREPEREFDLPLSFVVDGVLTRRVEITEMDGHAEDLFARESTTKREDADRTREALSRSIVRLGNKRRPDGKSSNELPRFFVKDLEQIPMQNQMLLLVRLRQLSVHDKARGLSGHKFVFTATCPHCKRHIPRLSTRLDNRKVEYLDDEFCSALVHEVEHRGHRIVWRTLTAEDSLKLSIVRDRGQEDWLSAFFAQAVVSIDGKDVKGRLSAVKDLSKATRNALKDAIDRGGIDTQITNKCPSCSFEFVHSLPWGQKSFFFPSAQ
jgi:hypothetical protein